MKPPKQKRVRRLLQQNLRPFRERLANYLHCPETDLIDSPAPRKSKMPFWSVVQCLGRVPPKSAEFIRQILLRIRRTIQS